MLTSLKRLSLSPASLSFPTPDLNLVLVCHITLLLVLIHGINHYWKLSYIYFYWFAALFPQRM